MRERARIMRAEVVDTVQKCSARAESAFLRFNQSLPRCQTAVFPLYGACVCCFPERTKSGDPRRTGTREPRSSAGQAVLI